MTTVYAPMDRPDLNFFNDRDRVRTKVQHEDEVSKLTVNYSNALASGETVSASSWDATGGVTTSGHALATPEATATITGTGGRVENTVTTSGGKTLVSTFRFIPPTGATTEDYPQ